VLSAIHPRRRIRREAKPKDSICRDDDRTQCAAEAGRQFRPVDSVPTLASATSPMHARVPRWIVGGVGLIVLAAPLTAVISNTVRRLAAARQVQE
jgi:hypothetical protein